MIIEETDYILTMGMKKSGKTHLSKKIAEKFPRQIIVDPMNEYSGDSIFYDFKAFKRKLGEINQTRPDRYRIVFRFHDDIEDPIPVFNEVCRLVYALGDCTFIADELHDFCTPQFLPHWFKNILMKGRHKGLSGIFITQRPSQLNKAVFSQVSHFFIGQLHEANDIKHVSNFVSVAKETLIHIGRRRFYYFSPFNDKRVIFSTEK